MPATNPDYNSTIPGIDMDAAFYKVLHPDTEPTENSQNLITSAAVREAIDEITERVTSVTLSSTWSGSDPYSQVISFPSGIITSRTRIDLQFTADQIASLITDGVNAMVVENDNGVVTCYAIGAAPSSQMTVQAILNETTG